MRSCRCGSEDDFSEKNAGCRKVEQIDCDEHQKCYPPIEHHKPLLQNGFSEKELHPCDQKDGEEKREEQRDQKDSGQLPADQGSLLSAGYPQTVNDGIILLVLLYGRKLLKGKNRAGQNDKKDAQIQSAEGNRRKSSQ